MLRATFQMLVVWLLELLKYLGKISRSREKALDGRVSSVGGNRTGQDERMRGSQAESASPPGPATCTWAVSPASVGPAVRAAAVQTPACTTLASLRSLREAKNTPSFLRQVFIL